MNVSKIQTVISVLIISIIGYLYFSLSKKITPSLYISNTYLYVSLAIAIACITVLQLAKYQYTLTSTHLLLIFILSLASMFGVKYFKHIVPRHIIWLVFVISMGVILYPMYQKTEEKGTLNGTIVTTLVLTIGLSIFATFSTCDFISWGSYLLFGLFALIVLEVCDMIFHSSVSGLNTRFKIYSCIAIVLFSGFILYDTQLLKKKSNYVTNDNVNYPLESIALFLDIANLFTNISNVN
ncbi:MAG: Bax inhibitor-1 family protein [Candidatus Colwellbacteria bacterium]|nr:Bax inhibitor-1 family protein [Candidatus Colwellbacteria bacterium]